jgi:autotransporter-associated beta strand protein
MLAKIEINDSNGGTQRMSKSNFENDTNGSNMSTRPMARTLKNLLTGCTALTMVAVVGLGAGSALADVTAGTGTTVNDTDSPSGIITLSGGTLNFNNTVTANTTLSNKVAATAATTSNVTVSGTYSGILTGVLSGTGAIKLNSGKLILSNSGDLAGYTGTFTVASGATLQLGNNTTSLIGGTVVNGSSIIDNGNVTVATTGSTTSTNTYYGAISGTGSFTLSGATSSALYLAGTNTYTGVTTVAAGNTLYIGNGNDYGSIASSSIVVNATTSGTTTTYGTITFNRSDTYIYSGNITGNGIVNQNGGGTLILNGNSTLTGPTVMGVNTSVTPNVNLGYLGTLRATKGWIMIGDASHTSASVTVTLANILSGAGMSGFGTLNGNLINGDDTPGTVSTRTSNTSQLVGGILMPGDGTVPGTFTINGNYTQGTYGALLITATPSSVSKLVVSGTASLHGQISVSGTKGSYTAGLYPILTAGAISGKFDTVLTGSPDSANTLGVYYASSGKEVDLVVAPKTIGQVYNDIVVHSFDTVYSLNEIVMDRTSTGCKGCTGFSVWGKTYTLSNSLEAGNGAAAVANHDLGVIGGVSYNYPSGLSFHAVLGSSSGNMRVHDSSASSRNVQVYASVAGHIPAGPVAFDVSYYYLDGWSSINRTDSLSNSLNSSIVSDVSGASIQVSAPFVGGDVVPFGKVSYSLLVTGSATEKGNGPYLLAVSHGHQTSGRYQVGVRIQHTYAAFDDMSIRPQLVLAGEANDRALGETNSMSMSSGASFFASSAAPGRFAALGRVGVDLVCRDLTFSLGVNGRKSSNQEQVLLNFGASYHF